MALESLLESLNHDLDIHDSSSTKIFHLLCSKILSLEKNLNDLRSSSQLLIQDKTADDNALDMNLKNVEIPLVPINTNLNTSEDRGTNSTLPASANDSIYSKKAAVNAIEPPLSLPVINNLEDYSPAIDHNILMQLTEQIDARVSLLEETIEREIEKIRLDVFNCPCKERESQMEDKLELYHKELTNNLSEYLSKSDYEKSMIPIQQALVRVDNKLLEMDAMKSIMLNLTKKTSMIEQAAHHLNTRVHTLTRNICDEEVSEGDHPLLSNPSFSFPSFIPKGGILYNDEIDAEEVLEEEKEINSLEQTSNSQISFSKVEQVVDHIQKKRESLSNIYEVEENKEEIYSSDTITVDKIVKEESSNISNFVEQEKCDNNQTKSDSKTSEIQVEEQQKEVICSTNIIDTNIKDPTKTSFKNLKILQPSDPDSTQKDRIQKISFNSNTIKSRMSTQRIPDPSVKKNLLEKQKSSPSINFTYQNAKIKRKSQEIIVDVSRIKARRRWAWAFSYLRYINSFKYGSRQVLSPQIPVLPVGVRLKRNEEIVQQCLKDIEISSKKLQELDRQIVIQSNQQEEKSKSEWMAALNILEQKLNDEFHHQIKNFFNDSKQLILDYHNTALGLMFFPTISNFIGNYCNSNVRFQLCNQEFSDALEAANDKISLLLQVESSCFQQEKEIQLDKEIHKELELICQDLNKIHNALKNEENGDETLKILFILSNKCIDILRILSTSIESKDNKLRRNILSVIKELFIMTSSYYSMHQLLKTEGFVAQSTLVNNQLAAFAKKQNDQNSNISNLLKSQNEITYQISSLRYEVQASVGVEKLNEALNCLSHNYEIQKKDIEEKLSVLSQEVELKQTILSEEVVKLSSDINLKVDKEMIEETINDFGEAIKCLNQEVLSSKTLDSIVQEKIKRKVDKEEVRRMLVNATHQSEEKEALVTASAIKCLSCSRASVNKPIPSKKTEDLIYQPFSVSNVRLLHDALHKGENKLDLHSKK